MITIVKENKNLKMMIEKSQIERKGVKKRERWKHSNQLKRKKSLHRGKKNQWGALPFVYNPEWCGASNLWSQE